MVDLVNIPPVVFELGLNHCGSLERALRMIDILKGGGATHITLQVLTEASSVMRDPAAIASLERFTLSHGDCLSAFGYIAESGLVAGATILNPGDVDSLVGAGVKFFKILSSDITFVPLIVAAAETGLPTYISTAAATFEEISFVVQTVRRVVPDADLRLIHTVLQIPTPAERLDLRNIPMLRSAMGVPVAYGQHSDLGDALLVATALGAEALFVYAAEERDVNLPDGPHAVLCSEAPALLARVRQVGLSLGSAARVAHPDDEKLRRRIRRSAVALRPLMAGACVQVGDVAFKRPGTGVEPCDVAAIFAFPLAASVELDGDIPAGRG